MFSNNTTVYNEELEDIYEFKFSVYEGTASKILSCVFIGILIIICVIGNATICIAFYYYKRLRVTTNYFMVSLAISDLLIGFIAMPIWLASEATGFAYLPNENMQNLAIFTELVDITVCVSSIINLTVISIDRLFGVVTPLKHKYIMTKKKVHCCLFIVWVYSLVIALTKLIKNFQYSIFLLVCGFGLPLSVILIDYFVIYITVRKNSKKQFVNQEWTVARSIFVVILVFVMCWLPFLLVKILYEYCMECTWFEALENVEHIVSAVTWLKYSNSCFNPFIYGFLNFSFRNAVASAIKRQFSQRGRMSFKDATSYVTTLSSHRPSVQTKLLEDRNRGKNVKLSEEGSEDTQEIIISGSSYTVYQRDAMPEQLDSSLNQLTRKNSKEINCLLSDAKESAI